MLVPRKFLKMAPLFRLRKYEGRITYPTQTGSSENHDTNLGGDM